MRTVAIDTKGRKIVIRRFCVLAVVVAIEFTHVVKSHETRQYTHTHDISKTGEI